MRQLKFIVERHEDGYVAYPLGADGVVVGEGDTCQEAFDDAQSALTCHIETFGAAVLNSDQPIIEEFIAEAGVAA